MHNWLQLKRSYLSGCIFKLILSQTIFEPTASPHIDDRDRSFQYALSLGDFKGGELCVEGNTYNNDNNKYEDFINVVKTRNRIARVDGRHIHWVRSWNGGDRYSLIFYDTTNKFTTPVIETGVYTKYLENS